MGNYENLAAKALIEQEHVKLRDEERKLDFERLEKRLEITEQRLNPEVLVPGELAIASKEGQDAFSGLAGGSAGLQASVM
jgi:hypothetical protein